MLAYKIKLTPDDNGTFLVTCAALPELTTFGKSVESAKRHALDAIEEALAARIAEGLALPPPAEADASPGDIALPTMTALKVLLWNALLEAGITRAELARRLVWHREQVDRLFRIEHASKLGMIDDAFSALGAEVTFRVKRSKKAA